MCPRAIKKFRNFRLWRPHIQRIDIVCLVFDQRRLEIDLKVTLNNILVDFIKGSSESGRKSEGAANQRFISTSDENFERKGRYRFKNERIKDDTSQRSVHSLTTSITMALCLDRISHPRFDRVVNKLIELTHQVDVGRLC